MKPTSTMKKLLLVLLLFTGMAKAQIVNIPDANFKAALIADGIDTSGDGEIQTFEAFVVNQLHIDNEGISNLIGLQSFVNVTSLYCDNNAITFLDLSNNPNINYIKCSYNQLSFINVSNNIGLTDLLCDNNNLNGINVSNNPNLTDLWIFNNNLTALDVSSCTNLSVLSCGFNLLTSLNLTANLNLTNLQCSNNQINNLNVSGLTNLNQLYCQFNQLPTLNLSGLTALQLINCNDNLITVLNISNNLNLTTIFCINNQLTSLNVVNYNNLQVLDCRYNQLISLSVSGTNMFTLNCSFNPISNLDITGLNGVNMLGELYCNNTNITTLDLADTFEFIVVECKNNSQLETLFLKNDVLQQSIDFDGNPNLSFICVDDNFTEINFYQGWANSYGYTNCNINSYCTFIPGGNYNTITGNITFDANNNGCDVSDIQHPNIRVTINDTSTQGSTFTNANGNYTFFTQAGSFDLTTNIENPSWFNFSPTSATIPFANNNNNTATQNFCISANGVHNDIEIAIAPISNARPGFDAEYKVVYRNKGNQTLSGAVNLAFDDTRTDFVSAIPIVDNITVNSLSWNFATLQPFESRVVNLILNINTPLETPAVNSGDILNFTTTINPITGDEFPLDNVFALNQTVVNSFDPNDITCLEGETVSPTEIGNYLHYVARFENLGTFQAENVVVKVIVDTNKYDINSLQLLNTSHPSYTRISGNVVEFIFEDINLAEASGNPPVGGHGDVLFKIRTKETLVTNDTVLQRAGIYFDYNFPVITNDAETTFVALSNPIFKFDISVIVSPNPTSSKINITSDFNIQSVELYDIQGRILSTSIENDIETVLDISNKQNGVYFLRINTESGSKVAKIVKE